MFNPHNYKYFFIKHGDESFFLIEMIINVFSALFENICYGFTAIINMFTLSVRGLTLDVRIWRSTLDDRIWRLLMSDYDDPRAVRVNTRVFKLQ